MSMNLQTLIRYVISVLNIKKKKNYINKRDGIEIVKELKVNFEVKTYCCDVCNYEVLLCKKTQHQNSLYHLDILKRRDNPEEFENEENPDGETTILGKQYFQCNKCHLSILTSNWHKHILTKEHLQKNEEEPPRP